MHNVSNEYSVEMKQPLRNHSYINVNIGLINQLAQSSSFLENPDGLYFSSSDIFGTNKRSYYYATFEQNFVKANGSMLFPPRVAPINMKNGYISNGIISQGPQSILINFIDLTSVNIKGLTIVFGDYYPVDFTIETDFDVITVTSNSSKRYTTDNLFENATFFRITATAMENPNRRLRIENVTFGIGVFFNNKNIKSMNLKSYISLISIDVPQQDFDLTVDNTSRIYNIENEESILNFFEAGQNIDVQYGYELSFGKIEWFKLASLKLKSWEADDSVAKFKAVDGLESMTGEYYKGVYSESGISLNDLAVLVFADAGYLPDMYEIDEYLKTIYTNNPLPRLKHRECLQIIANAGRCILSINDEGKPILKSSFIPAATATSDNQHYLSSVSKITMSSSKGKFATFEKDVTKLEGLIFAPRIKGSEETGYISSSISDENGYFDIEPSVTLSLEAVFICFGLTIDFDKNYPSQFTVETFKQNVLVETLNIAGVNKNTYSIKHEFFPFDKIVFNFTKTSVPYNRININSISFGDITDYKIEYNDLLATPKGIKLDKAKEVNIIKTEYSLSTDLDKQIFKGNKTVNQINNTVTLYFSKASHGYQVTAAGYVATVISSGAYYIQFSINGLPVENTVVSITVMGKEFYTSTTLYNKVINDTGYIKTLNNPLISSDNMAVDVLNWVSDYYASDKEYELEYRGDPALETGDITFLENEFNPNLMVKSYEHQLSFSGSIKGKLKARREVDV
ncbi:MAG: hypothetical protein K0R92_1511 [Lachnospiraceae bacterium]|jgi:hypothetical protein|nr:hypothetical protein [Lachnospiraceae bacterium]